MTTDKKELEARLSLELLEEGVKVLESYIDLETGNICIKIQDAEGKIDEVSFHPSEGEQLTEQEADEVNKQFPTWH